MKARRMLTGWFFAAGLSMVLACSSNQAPGAGRDDGGVGGSGGGGVGGATDGGGAGGSEEARFRCDGTLFCAVAREYCRDLASRGGASGTSDGGDPNSQHALSCVPFGDCPARDCSCVPQNYINFRCGCSQPDAGGTLASCGQI